MAEGSAHRVPLIVGNNAEEGRLFSRFLPLLPMSQPMIETLLSAAADRSSAIKVSRHIQRRWREFSRSGTPGDGWPAYRADQRAVLVFDRRPRIEYDPDADRRQAWEGFTLSTR